MMTTRGLPFFTKKKKQLKQLTPPPTPKPQEETPVPSRSNSSTSTARSDDPDLETAKLAIMDSSDLAREIEETEAAYVKIGGAEWVFYRTEIKMMDLTPYSILMTKEKRQTLQRVRFVKCSFEENAFLGFIAILIKIDKTLPPVDIFFNGYFEEEKEHEVPGGIPISEVCRIIGQSRFRIKLYSFQRCLFHEKKMNLIMQAVNSRCTNHEDCVPLTMHFEAENLMNRSYTLINNLLNIVSDVPWNPEEHSNKDIKEVEVVHENGQMKHFTLDHYNRVFILNVKYQTGIRRAKMLLDVSFDYFSTQALTLNSPRIPSSFSQPLLVERINDLIKKLREQQYNNIAEKNDAGFFV